MVVFKNAYLNQAAAPGKLFRVLREQNTSVAAMKNIKSYIDSEPPQNFDSWKKMSIDQSTKHP